MEENLLVEFEFGGIKVTSREYWWEGNDLHVMAPEGEYTFKNVYPIKLDFYGLDNSDKDVVVNYKIWK